jgi:predicted HTH transcriptional regulator
MKDWVKKVLELLDNNLSPIPHEVNEIDWKADLSNNSKKLSHHLSAFANHAGGGTIVFG